MTNKYMYFIANWKMFGVLNSLNSLHKVLKFLKTFKNNKSIKLIYCPPNTLIRPMTKKLKKSNIDVGAQNCHENEAYGAFTGSVNSKMLKSVGAKYVIIGHSENRQVGETNKLINNKIKSALKSGLKVIFCIGETLQEKRKRITKKVLNSQMKLGLNKIKNNKNILIAYEPVWSIGTGLIPKSEELYETINFIKKRMKNYKVLYGGSVNPKNINELKTITNIDGYLIGGASQDPKKFIDIIKKTYN
ncbi:triose-phosphate isomerase [Candidatus Pelagibacter sp. HIMB1483]|uniref:triose-phosphate isomerase n=1 Tax=Candidatus Pelagibacter sp. HIMB1483 TaxID=3415414 RepID=UPI003F8268A9